MTIISQKVPRRRSRGHKEEEEEEVEARAEKEGAAGGEGVREGGREGGNGKVSVLEKLQTETQSVGLHLQLNQIQ